MSVLNKLSQDQMNERYAVKFSQLHVHKITTREISRDRNNRFSRANQIEFSSSVVCLAVCKAGESSACLLVTKTGTNHAVL